MTHNVTQISYSTCILLSTNSKNFSEMARSLNLNPKQIAKTLPTKEDVKASLDLIFRSIYLRKNEVLLAIDITFVKKKYAKAIESAEQAYIQSDRCMCNAFKLSVAALIINNITIPLCWSCIAKNSAQDSLLNGFLRAIDFVKIAY